MFKQSNNTKKHVNVALAMLNVFLAGVVRNTIRQEKDQRRMEALGIANRYVRNHDGSKKGYRHEHNPAGTKLARLASNHACTVRSLFQLSEA